MHLDERTYRKLLAGDLPPAEARALARHLEGDCEACERFLADRPAADLVDGDADRVLASLTPLPAPAGNDLEYARIRRLARASPSRRRWAFPLVAAAAAAALAVAGVAGILSRGAAPDRPGWNGEKGVAVRGVPVRLRFVVVEPDGGLSKGVSGEAVRGSARLAFEVELGRAAEVALVRTGASGGPDVFFRERLGAGRHAVALSGRPAAYPLEGLDGPQRFALVASEQPLSADRVAGAARALAPPARVGPDVPALDGLSLDVVEVNVR